MTEASSLEAEESSGSIGVLSAVGGWPPFMSDTGLAGGAAANVVSYAFADAFNDLKERLSPLRHEVELAWCVAEGVCWMAETCVKAGSMRTSAPLRFCHRHTVYIRRSHLFQPFLFRLFRFLYIY
jgi:hypothetical protein